MADRIQIIIRAFSGKKIGFKWCTIKPAKVTLYLLWKWQKVPNQS